MAEDKTIEEQLKEMIVERLMLTIEPGDIEDDVNLMEAYDIDSIRLFEIVIGIEEVFGLSFEDDEFSIETFETVAAIAAKVREKQASEEEEEGAEGQRGKRTEGQNGEEGTEEEEE